MFFTTGDLTTASLLLVLLLFPTRALSLWLGLVHCTLPVSGAYILMILHSYVASTLFLLAGITYEWSGLRAHQQISLDTYIGHMYLLYLLANVEHAIHD